MVTRLFDLLRKPRREGRERKGSPAPAASMDALRAQFSGMPLFDAISDETLKKLEGEIEWFAVPGGWELFHQGDPGDGLYIVKSGRTGDRCWRPRFTPARSSARCL